VRIEGRRPEGPDADWVHLPDPIADAMKGLSSRIAALEQAVEEAVRNTPERQGAEVRSLRAAGAASEARTRVNPVLGPNPAGG
jgi:serine O-acetyltransferase